MIIDSVFRGDFSVESFPYAQDPEYKTHNRKVSELSTKLSEKLGPDKSILEELLNEVYAAQYIEALACFKIGFSIGLELHKEVEDEIKGLNLQKKSNIADHKY